MSDEYTSISEWGVKMADALAASPIKGVVSHGMGIVAVDLSDDIFDVGGTLEGLPAHHVNFVRNFDATLSASNYRLEFTPSVRGRWRAYVALFIAVASGVAAFVGPSVGAYVAANWGKSES